MELYAIAVILLLILCELRRAHNFLIIHWNREEERSAVWFETYMRETERKEVEREEAKAVAEKQNEAIINKAVEEMLIAVRRTPNK